MSLWCSSRIILSLISISVSTHALGDETCTAADDAGGGVALLQGQQRRHRRLNSAATAAAPPEVEDACPWKVGVTYGKGIVMCADGTYVTNWKCVQGGHGQRYQCPPNLPNMCADLSCGDDQDHCCKKDCSKRGGNRPCPDPQPQQAPAVSVEDDVLGTTPEPTTTAAQLGTTGISLERPSTGRPTVGPPTLFPPLWDEATTSEAPTQTIGVPTQSPMPETSEMPTAPPEEPTTTQITATTDEPSTDEPPTTPEEPTTDEPTTPEDEPTTDEPTTPDEPTTDEPSTDEPPITATTDEPSTDEPTTATTDEPPTTPEEPTTGAPAGNNDISDENDIGDDNDFEDRYPAVFDKLQVLLQGDTTLLKLLSFGCVNGTESRALRTYFPTAIIDGVDILDISDEVIAKSNASSTDPNIKYYDTVDDLAPKSYNAILAMDVLRKGGTKPLKHSRYVETIHMLDRLLLPGGYLVIYNADYPFSEYPHNSRYQNMCRYDSSEHIVAAADISRHRSDNPNLRALSAGMCSFLDRFCIEGGWRRKFDAAGNQVQKHGERSVNGNETMLMSHGCKYPGTFFKKMVTWPE